MDPLTHCEPKAIFFKSACAVNIIGKITFILSIDREKYIVTYIVFKLKDFFCGVTSYFSVYSTHMLSPELLALHEKYR